MIDPDTSPQRRLNDPERRAVGCRRAIFLISASVVVLLVSVGPSGTRGGHRSHCHFDSSRRIRGQGGGPQPAGLADALTTWSDRLRWRSAPTSKIIRLGVSRFSNERPVPSKELLVDMSSAGAISPEQSDSTPSENCPCAQRGDIAQVPSL